MSIFFSHPTGNANVRAALQGFSQAGLLSAFYTGIASFEGDFLDRISTVKALSEVRRRRFDSAIQPLTQSTPWREVARLLALKAGLSSLTKHETGILSVDAVYRHLDQHVSKELQTKKNKNIRGVYCYEDGAISTFREANRLGITTLYDLPIGYWRAAQRLLQNEVFRWPEWQTTLKGFQDSQEKLNRKDEEIRLADIIFVASSFTAKTLQDFPGKLPAIKVIPYGYPDIKERREYIGVVNRKKLKLLFVGGLSQRKGIADLFSVVDTLEDYIELTIVGKKAVENCSALNEALNKHNWIPSLPHYDVLNLMRQQDVLVFPSLFEGFGLVITEAMSQGLPVITTDRTAGPDLIRHKNNGWLIEAGSTIALQEAIEHFVQDFKQVAKLGREAQETASQRPWTVYGNELAAEVKKIFLNKNDYSNHNA